MPDQTMCLSYSQSKASQGPHSLNVFSHSTNVSAAVSLFPQYKPLRGPWRYFKIRMWSRTQKKKGYAIIYALKIHWVCSKMGLNKKRYRPTGLTTLSLKQRSEGCLGSYSSVGFFFFWRIWWNVVCGLGLPLPAFYYLQIYCLFCT